MPGPNLAGTGEALDASLNTIISEFYRLRDETPKLKQEATRFTLAEHSGRSKVTLDYGRLIARNLSDGQDLTEAQDLSDSQNTYSPSEVGLKVILPRTTVRRVADPDLMAQAGRIMAAAYNLKEDVDGTAAFSSFTIALGTAGVILGPGLVSAAVTNLRTGGSLSVPEPAPEPYVGVFHPCSIHAVANRIIPLSDVPVGTNVYAPPSTAGVTVGPGRSSNMSERILQMGTRAVGELMGARIVSSANIAVDASNDAIASIFSREGLIYVSEFEPQEEIENDASLRGKELVLTGSYVWGVHRPAAYGTAITVDAVLPTG